MFSAAPTLIGSLCEQQAGRGTPLSPIALVPAYLARVVLPMRGDLCPDRESAGRGFFLQRHAPSASARRM
jgi:hypothetical protein